MTQARAKAGAEFEHANSWGYRRVPRWRRVACWLIGHRWAFVVGQRPSGGDRYCVRPVRFSRESGLVMDEPRFPPDDLKVDFGLEEQR